MKKTCLHCGAEYEAQRHTSRFCCPNHRVAYHRKTQSTEEPPVADPGPKPKIPVTPRPIQPISILDILKRLPTKK